jgi:hypothetical protein
MPPSQDNSTLSNIDMPGDELDSAGIENRPRYTLFRRKQLIQVALLMMAIGTVLATFWTLTAPKQSSYSGPLISALLVSNVNFGTITLNGQHLASHPPLKTMIHADANDLTLVAPPFQAYTCHFQRLSISQTDHCLSTREAVAERGGDLVNTVILGIFLLPDNLPLHQRASALALINRSLVAQHTTVPTGSYFATSIDQTAMITSQIAPAPLQATATFTPDTPSTLRIDPANAALLTRPTWGLAFSVALRWRFLDASGEAISNVTYPATAGIGLFMAYTPSTGWQLSKGLGEDLPSQLVGTICSAGAQVLQQETGRTFHSISLPAPATPAGCLIQVQENGNPVGEFLWSFGVLFAADQTAHASLPALPIAPPKELDAAQG